MQTKHKKNMVSDPEEGGFLLINQEQLNLAWVLLQQ